MKWDGHKTLTKYEFNVFHDCKHVKNEIFNIYMMTYTGIQGNQVILQLRQFFSAQEFRSCEFQFNTKRGKSMINVKVYFEKQKKTSMKIDQFDHHD